MQNFDENMEHPAGKQVRFMAICSTGLQYEYNKPAALPSNDHVNLCF